MNCLYCEQECELMPGYSARDLSIKIYRCGNHYPACIEYDLYTGDDGPWSVLLYLEKYTVSIVLKTNTFRVYTNSNLDKNLILNLHYYPANFSPENAEEKIKLLLAFS